MKPKEILVFGASGQIGRHLIRKLTKNNYKVIAITRNYHQKAFILKTQANPGYLDIVEVNIYDYEKINSLIKNSDICINLIGILYENKRNTFKNIHTIFPSLIAKLCKENNLDQFIQISALGIEESINCNYSKSKLEGEKLIKENFPKSTILRPSLVYSIDDSFTTKFFTLLNIFPVFPLYYNGDTKFCPIHVNDFVEIIYQIINKKIHSEIIECVGPQTLSLKEIIKIMLNSLEKKRLLIPIPLGIAKVMARIMQLFMSKPLLTLDQLNLLYYDNIATRKYKTNFDININAQLKFANEIEKYSYMWKDKGQFSKKKVD